jgi:hypothetical protein
MKSGRTNFKYLYTYTPPGLLDFHTNIYVMAYQFSGIYDHGDSDCILDGYKSVICLGSVNASKGPSVSVRKIRGSKSDNLLYSLTEVRRP